MKDEKSRTGSNFDGHATLRRNAVAKQNTAVTELQKIRRQNIDSGYSTSDGLDKRWSQEMPTNGATATTENGIAKWSPTAVHVRTSPTNAPAISSPYLSRSGVSTPLLSPAGNNNLSICNNGDEFKRPLAPAETSTPKRNLNGSNSNRYRIVFDNFFDCFSVEKKRFEKDKMLKLLCGFLIN